TRSIATRPTACCNSMLSADDDGGAPTGIYDCFTQERSSRPNTGTGEHPSSAHGKPRDEHAPPPRTCGEPVTARRVREAIRGPRTDARCWTRSPGTAPDYADSARRQTLSPLVVPLVQRLPAYAAAARRASVNDTGAADSAEL